LGRCGHGRADCGWVRLCQARHTLGGRGPPVVRRAGQGGHLPGQCGGRLRQRAGLHLGGSALVPARAVVHSGVCDAPAALRGAAPVEVGTLAALLPATAWTRQQIKEGAKGPLEAEFAFVRAVAVRDGRPGPEVWVVLRRSLDETPELKAYLSNAPADTPQATLVWLCGMRWPAESASKEGKGEVGLDHYEVRGRVGWHHHVTMTFLAHNFLVRARLR